MSNNGPFFLIKNFGCTQHSSSKLGSVFAGTKFKSFEYLAALNIVQVNLALYSLARNFFCFCILFPRETRERPFCCFLFITPFFTCSNGMFSRRSRRFTQTKDRLVNETISTITAVLAFLAEIKCRN